MNETFQMVDSHDDDRLSRREVIRAFSDDGELDGESLAFFNHIYNSIDTNGNGFISFEEFVVFFTNFIRNE